MSTTSTSKARQRIEALLDENSFVEIGALVSARATDFNLKQLDTPSDGVITGYGVINDNLVYVYSQDASVMNGTIGEMHAKKIANLYDMALKMGAPVIGLIDSAGLRLQEATDALNAFGEIYMKQSMASGVIPQITAIFGTCGGGLAVIPTLTDFTFMEEKDAKLFVNAPNTLDGNSTAKCDTASAKFQSEEAGIVDFVGAEAELFGQIRDLVSYLPANNEEEADYAACDDDLNRACAQAAAGAKDAVIALSDIADDGVFVEVKKAYAKDMVVGFLKLNGMTESLAGNILELINDDVLVGQFDVLPFNFLQVEMCIIDHVRKVNLISLLQNRLIVMIYLFRDLEKQKRSRIICFLPKNRKRAFIIAGSLILFDEVHHEKDELVDVLVFSALNNLLINFFQIARMKNKAFSL